jgi:2-haloalkanoic acid dehalogenase type II
MKPRLFTFDIFGTVVDWQRGLQADLARVGHSLERAQFDRIVDAQGADEQAQFRPYREITARSLVRVLGLALPQAEEIGSELGRWPPFADAAAGLAALLKLAPCVAMTNSDRQHAAGVQSSLGFALSDWVCAEEVGVYKPSPEFWHAVSRRLGVPPGPAWWHVSAYADYDLRVAGALGLSTVFVQRPHRRPGPARWTVRDLLELAELAARSGHA